MKLLHTADWHVGKTIRGFSRADEHRAVLGEMVEVARAEAVDAVLVCGDLYESAAPSAESEAIVLRTLLELRNTDAAVFVIAGNHDNAERFEALRPLLAELGITVLGRVARPEAGGVVEHTTAAGERLHLAMVPFLSQRYSVRGAELMQLDAAQAAGQHAERVRLIVGALTSDFGRDAVNVVMSHGMVRGGQAGGGEREAHTAVDDYWLDASSFPPAASYVALGHLHLAQRMPGGAPIHYSGSPIQVDFGEAGAEKQVLVVEAAPGKPAQVRAVPLERGEQLRTLTGSLDDVRAVAEDPAVRAAWLRVRLDEAPRAGLADEVRELLGERCVAVELVGAKRDAAGRRISRSSLGPTELFHAYLEEQGIEDERVEALFARLLDAETTGEAA